MAYEINTDLSQPSTAVTPKLFYGEDTRVNFPDSSKNLPPDTQTKKNPEDNLEVTAQKFNAVSEQLGISLQFKRDQDTGATVISLVDVSSGKAIKQIPNESLLRLSASLGELQGNFIDKHV